MITRFGLAPRRAGLTVAQFQEHWRERHAPIIGALPGLGRYWQNHAVASALPWPGFDACSEMDAPDVAAFDAVFAQPHYLTQGRDDERRFVDRSGGGAMLTRRIGSAPASVPAAGGVRLLTFLRGSPATLAAALGEPGRGDTALCVEGFVRVDDDPDAVFDAVEALWFPDAAAALAHLGSAAGERDRRGLTGAVRGTERLLATVHVVPLTG